MEDAVKAVDRATGPRSVVTFRLGEHEFAVDVDDMHEVVRYRAPRAVPGGPAFLEGVLEVRGVVLPVMDLRTRFGLDAGSGDGETRVLVASVDGERIGLIVDAVTDVVTVPPDSLSQPEGDIGGAAHAQITGIVSLDDRRLMLFGPDGLLTDDERRALLGTEGD